MKLLHKKHIYEMMFNTQKYPSKFQEEDVEALKHTPEMAAAAAAAAAWNQGSSIKAKHGFPVYSDSSNCSSSDCSSSDNKEMMDLSTLLAMYQVSQINVCNQIYIVLLLNFFLKKPFFKNNLRFGLKEWLIFFSVKLKEERNSGINKSRR